MKAYKVELLIIDFDEVGKDIEYHIEHASYPNRCLSPHVMSIQEADIGEWDDNHLLNKRDTMLKEYIRLFGK